MTTYTRYETSGTEDTFSVPFPYENENDVEVTLDGVITTNYTWVGPNAIQLGVTPAAGSELIIRRLTDASIQVNYQPDVKPSAATHNKAYKQPLFVGEEARDFAEANLDFARELEVDIQSLQATVANLSSTAGNNPGFVDLTNFSIPNSRGPDASAGLNNALIAARDSGKILYIPAGDYDLDNPIIALNRVSVLASTRANFYQKSDAAVKQTDGVGLSNFNWRGGHFHYAGQGSSLDAVFKLHSHEWCSIWIDDCSGYHNQWVYFFKTQETPGVNCVFNNWGFYTNDYVKGCVYLQGLETDYTEYVGDGSTRGFATDFDVKWPADLTVAILRESTGELEYMNRSGENAPNGWGFQSGSAEGTPGPADIRFGTAPNQGDIVMLFPTIVTSPINPVSNCDINMTTKLGSKYGVYMVRYVDAIKIAGRYLFVNPASLDCTYGSHVVSNALALAARAKGKFFGPTFPRSMNVDYLEFDTPTFGSNFYKNDDSVSAVYLGPGSKNVVGDTIIDLAWQGGPFHIDDNRRMELTGTISATTGSKTITGTGTKFTEELNTSDIGVFSDFIEFAGHRYKITSINSDTELEIVVGAKDTGSGFSFYRHNVLDRVAMKLRSTMNTGNNVTDLISGYTNTQTVSYGSGDIRRIVVDFPGDTTEWRFPFTNDEFGQYIPLNRKLRIEDIEVENLSVGIPIGVKEIQDGGIVLRAAGKTGPDGQTIRVKIDVSEHSEQRFGEPDHVVLDWSPPDLGTEGTRYNNIYGNTFRAGQGFFLHDFNYGGGFGEVLRMISDNTGVAYIQGTDGTAGSFNFTEGIKWVPGTGWVIPTLKVKDVDANLLPSGSTGVSQGFLYTDGQYVKVAGATGGSLDADTLNGQTGSYYLSAVNHSGYASVATSGSYNDLSNRPSLATVATTGSYNDLLNAPSLATVATTGFYSDLTGTPSLAPVATSGAYSDLTGTPSLATVATSGSYNDLSNKPNFNNYLRDDQDNIPDMDDTYDLGSSTNRWTDGWFGGTVYGDRFHMYVDAYGAQTFRMFGDSGGQIYIQGKDNGGFWDTAGAFRWNPFSQWEFDGDVTFNGAVSGLATVATSGAYSDLTGTPSLATVATSGSYNDLSNTPTNIIGSGDNVTWTGSHTFNGSVTINDSPYITTPFGTNTIIESTVDNGNDGHLTVRKSRGGSGAKTSVQNFDFLGSVVFDGYDGSSWVTGAEISAQANDVTDPNLGTRLKFFVNGNGHATFFDGGYTEFFAGGKFNGSLTVAGALSKSSGSFKIDHPLYPEDKHLIHSFVEAPTADNIYRGRAEVQKTACISIDRVANMSKGTFKALNRNPQVFVQNETGWSPVKARVEDGHVLIYKKEDREQVDTISWMVIGERKDQHMIDQDWTDEQGRVIPELPKEGK